jgi:hypothetical protein
MEAALALRASTACWCAAKWEHTTAIFWRCSVKATAAAPLLPPTPSTPQATDAVATSPITPRSPLRANTSTSMPLSWRSATWCQCRPPPSAPSAAPLQNWALALPRSWVL